MYVFTGKFFPVSAVLNGSGDEGRGWRRFFRGFTASFAGIAISFAFFINCCADCRMTGALLSGLTSSAEAVGSACHQDVGTVSALTLSLEKSSLARARTGERRAVQGHCSSCRVLRFLAVPVNGQKFVASSQAHRDAGGFAAFLVSFLDPAVSSGPPAPRVGRVFSPGGRAPLVRLYLLDQSFLI